MVTLSEADFTAGRCGLVVSTLAIGARGPRIEPTLQTVSLFFFLTKFSAIHTFRSKIFTAVHMSTQPSTLHGTVK